MIEVEPSISEKNTAKRRFDALFAAQLADHVIEGLRENADLVSGGDRHRGVEVTARVHLELLRRATPAPRPRRGCVVALSLTRTTLGLSRAILAKNLPGVSPEEIGLRFAAGLYVQVLADDIRADLVARRQ